MRHIFFSVLIALFAVSCGGTRYVDYFPYHDDGVIKPRIAFIPIKDSSQSGVPWDMSVELSSAMYSELMNSGELYVLSHQEVGDVWSRCSEIEFFGIDLDFTQQFCNADFIVALELIEHSVKPHPFHSISSPNPESVPCNRMLTMKVRVRVLDVRFGKPKDILYEIVKTDYLITAPYDDLDYSKCGWGWERFHKTPYGMAHQRMINCLTSRLEEAIWSAK
jgi:hypothetical protein